MEVPEPELLYSVDVTSPLFPPREECTAEEIDFLDISPDNRNLLLNYVPLKRAQKEVTRRGSRGPVRSFERATSVERSPSPLGRCTFASVSRADVLVTGT